MRELTKNRAALLQLFFTNPQRSFYIQEIGRILNKKPGVFQRTLNYMEKEGILLSEYRANARYFRANKAYPLFKELKSIVMKTVGVIGGITAVLEKVGGVSYAFIYGSYARANENSLSDIDLIVIGKPDEDKLLEELDRLEEQLQREINYKLFSLPDFTRDIAHKSPFLLEILKDKKIMIMGDEGELRKILKG